MNEVVERSKSSGGRVFSQGYLSKIETAKTALPDWEDIASLLHSIGATQDERDSIRRQHDICQLDENSYAYIHSVGVDAKQRQIGQLTASATAFRCYSRSVFPGIIQTYDYGMGVFASIGLNPEAAVAAMAARLERGRAISDQEKAFILIVDECALYSPHPADLGLKALRGQLDYTLKISYNRNIKLRFVRGKSPLNSDVAGPFLLLDRRYVTAECIDREISASDARTIALYERVFDALFDAAEDEESSRSMILEALDFFATRHV